ncbi:O-antigen ligase family protein [Gemmiger formicilis]|uniref:O-antigen ligase family protein n=1 Tax=Gemmiger formicilis TaxID=745368 RepID=UPI0011C92107|nr:O-antigen ligase family protein [Gemmiger formicilis]
MNISLSNRTVQFLTGLLCAVLYAVVGVPEIIALYFLVIYCKELKELLSKNYEEVVEQGIYLIPLLGITVYRGIPLGNIYLALFSLYIMLVDRKVGMRRKTFTFFSFVVFLDIVRYVIYIGDNVSILSVISVPVLYLCMFSGIAAYEICKTKKAIMNIMVSFIEGTATSIVYGFVVRMRQGGVVNAILNVSILNRNSGASGDPNYYGLYICIASSFLIVLMGLYESYDLKAFALVAGMIFMGLSSSSRMFYILAMICIAALLAIMIRNLFITKKQIGTIAFFIVLMLFLWFARNIISANISYLLSRMDYSSTSKLTNGRSDLAYAYISYMDSSVLRPILGIGIAQYNLRSGVGHYAHNVYIELYVTMGILGAIAVGALLLYFLVKNFSLKNWRIFIAVIILVLGGAAVNYLEVDSFYILFAVIAKMIVLCKGVTTNE